MVTVGKSIGRCSEVPYFPWVRGDSTSMFKAPRVWVTLVSVAPLLSLHPTSLPALLQSKPAALVQNNNFLNSLHLCHFFSLSFPSRLLSHLTTIPTYICSTLSGSSNHTDRTNPLNLFASISNISPRARHIPQHHKQQEDRYS